MENQTEILELKRKLEEQKSQLYLSQRRERKLKTGFFGLLTIGASIALIECGPGVYIPNPSLTASSICSGTSMLGTLGTAICITAYQVMDSNIYRNQSTTQLTQAQEVTTYAGSGSSPTLPTGYREIAAIESDDDGYNPYTSSISQYGTRPQKACGGPIYTSIGAKIANCASLNGANATWTGSTSGTGGQATWELVFSSGQAIAGTCKVPNGSTNQYSTDCYEVWEDERTGLLWSSSLTRNSGGANGGSVNWCIASGNGSVSGQTSTDPSGTDNQGSYCNNGSGTYQNSSGAPWSSCAEYSSSGVLLTAVPGFCTDGNGQHNTVGLGCAAASYTNNILTYTGGLESYTTGNYHIAKGYMGALSNPGVRWRLPTKYDYQQADNDGIRFVMPDMGTAGGSNNRASDSSPGSLNPVYEWSSSLLSFVRSTAWYFYGFNGLVSYNSRTNPYVGRCVGR